MIEEKEAEVVVEPDNMLALVKESERGVYSAMSSMDTLDWAKLKPNQTALLLMQKPMSFSGGGTGYLTFKQALLFAVRAFELGLSPFSDCLWFDPNKSTVNLTLAGKRELARIRGIPLGPPSFEEVTREWADIPKLSETAEELKKAGYVKDVGIKCTMRVGAPELNEKVNYVAWMSEWFQSKSPVWKSKSSHMLTIRANEKALTLIIGTGVSAMPDERELE